MPLTHVSIVIPYYKNRDFIQPVVHAIDRSFTAAGLKGEILIIDDCSKDNLALEPTSLPLRIIPLTERSGVSRARNKGVDEAKHEWLLFVDSDVEIHPKAMQYCMESLEKNPTVRGITGVYNPYTSGKAFLSKFLSSYATFTWTHINPSEIIHPVEIIWSQFLLVTKTAVLAAGGYDVSVSKPCLEDVELSIHMNINGNKMILDKRIENTHLKEVALKQISDNYLSKARSWVDLKTTYLGYGFEYKGYESTEKKASLISSTLAVICFLASPLIAPAFWAGLFFLVLFIASNLRFYFFSNKIFGPVYAIRSIPFLFYINMITLYGVGSTVFKKSIARTASFLRRFLRLFKNYVFKSFGELESMTVFVTNKCNYSCEYCCYADHINQKEDVLSLEELTRVSQNIGTVENVILTGGEPFLRKDIVQIACAFYQNAGVRKISMITNGSMPSKVRKDILEILQLCPHLHLIINLSYEGNQLIQEKTRGEKSYFRLKETFSHLNGIAKFYKRLKVEFIYTFHKNNQHTLLQDIQENIKTDKNMITLNLQRGTPENKFIEGLDVSKYEEVSQLIFRHNETGYHFFLSGVVRNAKRLSQHLNFLTYQTRKFHTPCYAGRLNATLYNTGELFPCEMLKRGYGNVRNNTFGVKNMLKLDDSKALTRAIITEKCFCTHECNQITNVLFNPRFLIQLLSSGKLSYRQKL